MKDSTREIVYETDLFPKLMETENGDIFKVDKVLFNKYLVLLSTKSDTQTVIYYEIKTRKFIDGNHHPLTLKVKTPYLFNGRPKYVFRRR